MQVIYSGKTKACQPRGFTFPKGFSVSQNPKHWSNEAETLTLIKEVINPYIITTRKELDLPTTQRTLLIWDVFKGQVPDTVKTKLESLFIELVTVPANMTHFFQPLVFTVNRAAKNSTRRKFVAYYSTQVQKELASGKRLEEIEVDLRVIKPIHAEWLVDFFSTVEGRTIIMKGWKKPGISGLLNGTTVLPPDNPFENIYTESEN